MLSGADPITSAVLGLSPQIQWDRHRPFSGTAVRTYAAMVVAFPTGLAGQLILRSADIPRRTNDRGNEDIVGGYFQQQRYGEGQRPPGIVADHVEFLSDSAAFAEEATLHEYGHHLFQQLVLAGQLEPMLDATASALRLKTNEAFVFDANKLVSRDLSDRRPPPGAVGPSRTDLAFFEGGILLSKVAQQEVRKSVEHAGGNPDLASLNMNELCAVGWQTFLQSRRPGRLASAIGTTLVNWFGSTHPHAENRQVNALAAHKMWMKHGGISWYPDHRRPEELRYFQSSWKELRKLDVPQLDVRQHSNMVQSLRLPNAFQRIVGGRAH